MSRRTPAVKKSSGRKYEGARANTRHASGDGFAQMQPVQQSRTEYHLPQPVFAPARQHDRIEIRRQTLQTGGLTENQPSGRATLHSPTRRRSKHDLIGWHALRQMKVRHGENLHRPDDIEGLNAVISNHGDAPGVVCGYLHWRKLRYL